MANAVHFTGILLKEVIKKSLLTVSFMMEEASEDKWHRRNGDSDFTKQLDV